MIRQTSSPPNIFTNFLYASNLELPMKELRTTRLKTSEIICGAIILVAFLIGIFVGSNYVHKTKVVALQRDAIQKGFAEWVVVDSENGATEFSWKVIELSAN